MEGSDGSPMRDEILQFVESHAQEVEHTPAGKVRFKRTGMEFPQSCSVNTLESYWKGKAMRRALVAKANASFDFATLLPHIVPDKRKNPSAFMYCHLTNKTLPRNAAVLQKHISGKRYRRALAKLEKLEEERRKAMLRHKEQKMKLDSARLHSIKGSNGCNGKEENENGSTMSSKDGSECEGDNGTDVDREEDNMVDDEVPKVSRHSEASRRKQTTHPKPTAGSVGAGGALDGAALQPRKARVACTERNRKGTINSISCLSSSIEKARKRLRQRMPKCCRETGCCASVCL